MGKKRKGRRKKSPVGLKKSHCAEIIQSAYLCALNQQSKNLTKMKKKLFVNLRVPSQNMEQPELES